MLPEPSWWRYRNEPDALHTIALLLGEDAHAGRLDPTWCRSEAAEIDAHLRRVDR